MQLVDMWNKHSCWVATEIVLLTDLDKRRETLKWCAGACIIIAITVIIIIIITVVIVTFFLLLLTSTGSSRLRTRCASFGTTTR